MLNSERYTVVTEILIRDTYVDEKQEIYKIVTLKTSIFKLQIYKSKYR